MLPFTLHRPLTWIDLETTGKDPREARIVEMHITQFMPDGSPVPTKEWTGRFNPATAKHGIVDADVATCPPFASAAERLLPAFKGCDYGGYNVRYDLDVLKAEYARLLINTERAENDPPARIIDGLRLWQLAEPRTLSDFVKRWTGESHEGAHGAAADVAGTIRGIVGLLSQVPQSVLPHDLQALHDLQFPRDPDAVDSEGMFKRVDGQVVFTFGKHRGKPVRSERSYFKWWLDQPGRNTAEYRKLAKEIFG
jgi:DNA polymerase-3 subunit epsilon